MKELENAYLSKFKEFDDHELVVKIEDEETGLKGYIAIHRILKHHPSLGATRLWLYHNEEDALRDSMRLAKLMSLKSALAGLPYGGAKAALVFPASGIKDRQKYFEKYGEEVEKLAGKFVTGTDVGLTNADLDFMKNKTKYVIGHGVESGYYTAIGVLDCVKEVFKHLFGSRSVAGKSFAVQGVGKTGGELVKLLVKEGVNEIYIADIEKSRTDEMVEQFPFVKVVLENEIHKCKVDVFSPSALSGVLNEKTVPELHCKAVIGSANNQLADKKVMEMLENKGIIYVPDYLANSGGIISVVDQFLNIYPEEERIKDRIKKIPENLSLILEQSKTSKKSLEYIANDLAQKILAAS